MHKVINDFLWKDAIKSVYEARMEQLQSDNQEKQQKIELLQKRIDTLQVNLWILFEKILSIIAENIGMF